MKRAGRAPSSTEGETYSRSSPTEGKGTQLEGTARGRPSAPGSGETIEKSR